MFGITSPIPGVSGGSLAVFTNNFEELIHSASWANLKKNLLLLLSFVAGVACSLFWVSKGIEYLIAHHGQILLFSFMGLIIGCVPSLFKKAAKSRIGVTEASVFVLALSIMLILFFFGEESNKSLQEFGGTSPELLVKVFAASFISSIAILIPGVGGAVVMLAFGIYGLYIEAISTPHWGLIAVFAVSMVLGIAAGVIVIKKMLIKSPQKLYSAILGFLTGSLLIIYPGFSPDMTGGLSVVFALGFSALTYYLTRRE